MLIKPKSAKDFEEDYFLRALLVGQSKSGKTESACTVPGKKLVLNFDGRIAALLGRDDIEIIEFMKISPPSRAWENLVEFVNSLWAQTENFPYSAIIPDGLTGLNEISMRFVLGLKQKDKNTKKYIETPKGLGGTPLWSYHYMPQNWQVREVLMSLLSLPCHIIVTAHLDRYEYEDENGKQIVEYLPKTYGKIRTEIGSWFDEVYECVQEPSALRGSTYKWNTQATPGRPFLGSAINKRGKLWKSPMVINLDENPTGFAKILQLRKEVQS